MFRNISYPIANSASWPCSNYWRIIIVYYSLIIVAMALKITQQGGRGRQHASSGNSNSNGKKKFFKLWCFLYFLFLTTVGSNLNNGSNAASLLQHTITFTTESSSSSSSSSSTQEQQRKKEDVLVWRRSHNNNTTISDTIIKQQKITIRLDLEVGKRNTEFGLVPMLETTTSHQTILQKDDGAQQQHEQQQQQYQRHQHHLINLSLQPVTSPAPWPNLTTLAFYQGSFYSGYRNQMMVFTMIVFQTVQEGHGQLLLDSLALKDTYGSNQHIPFSKLWSVPHWNSHHPQLPRLVEYDPILHDQYNPQDSPPFFQNENKTQFENYDRTLQTNIPVRPHAFGIQNHLMAAYMRYTKGRGPYAVAADAAADASRRNPLEILMLQGALRPHPDLEAIIQDKLRLLREGTGGGGGGGGGGGDYMTLHARVEPDMQRHPVCPDKKVLNLTTIFEFLEDKWKDEPPYNISRIFMPINRQYLEQEGGSIGTAVKNENINWIAVENLRALNRARDQGLWGGRVRVYEFGASTLVGTPYESKPSTPGAMLNFFIGIQAKIFVGTEVSSYSHDLLATRFFRGYRQDNYKYLPEQGLVEWTPPHIHDPPGFGC